MSGSKKIFFSTVSFVAIIGALNFSAHANDSLDVWGGPYLAFGGAGKFARGEGNLAAYGFAEAGYDFAVPNSKFIVGVVGNYDFGEADEIYDGATELRNGFEYRIGKTWGVGARVGVKTMHSLLLYGVAGFTQAEMSDECDFRNDAKKCPELIGREYVDSSEAGYFVGAGVETAFSDHVAAKLEYRYEDYGDFEDLDHMNSHSVRGSLVFRMGKHGDDY